MERSWVFKHLSQVAKGIRREDLVITSGILNGNGVSGIGIGCGSLRVRGSPRAEGGLGKRTPDAIIGVNGLCLIGRAGLAGQLLAYQFSCRRTAASAVGRIGLA